MKVVLCKDSNDLGKQASIQATACIKEAIAKTGNARILLSTGASQFTFFEHFVKEDIDWDKVEMFHLDEYVGCSIDHPASFKKYLTERFINVVGLKNYHLIDGTKDPQETINELTELLNQKQEQETDSQKFAKEYSTVTEDNYFVYRNAEEIIKILEHGTGVVYLGFPECPWCQAYVPMLNEVSDVEGLEKIYYYLLVSK